MIVRERRAIGQLAELLDGELPVARADQGVRELASLAGGVTEHATLPTPTADVRAALRTRLVAEVDALGAPTATPTLLERTAESVSVGTARARRSGRLALATGLASTMLGTAGVAAAAQSALPGETLYPVKRTTESLRMALADGLVDEGRLEFAFAGERLDELGLAIDHLSSQQTVGVLDDMDTASVAGTDALLTVARTQVRPELFIEVADFAQRQRAGLVALLDQLPITARAEAEQSLALLRRIEAQLITAASQVCECRDADGERVTGDDAAGCDCLAEVLGEQRAQRLRDGTGSLGSAGSSDDVADTSDGVGEFDDQLEPDGSDNDYLVIPTLPEPLDTVGRAIDASLTGLLGGGSTTDDTSGSGDGGDTTDETRDTVDDTTDKTRDTVDDTTDDANDTTGGTGESVDDTTSGDDPSETVDDTSDTVGDTVDDTSDDLDDTVDGDDLGDLLDE